MQPDLSVDIGGIRMLFPVMNCSGTFRIQGTELIDLKKLGAFVTKSITLEPREGNDQPRMNEAGNGLINRIGLQGVGVDEFCRSELPKISGILEDTPIIVSVAGSTVDEYLAVIEVLIKEAEWRISGIELNVSCPNVGAGGLAFGTNPKMLYSLVVPAVKLTDLPTIVKLTPNVTDIREVAKAAEAAGARAVSLINTLKGMALIRGYEEDGKIKGLDARKWVIGGYSGPPIKPVALYMVNEVAQAVNIPIIGMGGICNAQDVLEFFLVGASAVAVGTYNFVEPSAIAKISDGVAEYLIKRGYSNIVELKQKEGIRNNC